MVAWVQVCNVSIEISQIAVEDYKITEHCLSCENNDKYQNNNLHKDLKLTTADICAICCVYSLGMCQTTSLA